MENKDLKINNQSLGCNHRCFFLHFCGIDLIDECNNYTDLFINKT